jgi:hypothetical protein
MNCQSLTLKGSRAFKGEKAARADPGNKYFKKCRLNVTHVIYHNFALALCGPNTAMEVFGM